MDNENTVTMLDEALSSYEAARELWAEEGMGGERLDFYLRLTQTEGLLSIAQSLAVLARLADDELKARFGPGEL